MFLNSFTNRSIFCEFKTGAKVCEPNVSVHIQENVVWFDVSVGEKTQSKHINTQSLVSKQHHRLDRSTIYVTFGSV